MIEDRNQASCVAIRAIPSSPAFTRCSYWPASSDDMTMTCGSPGWIGRSLACVCIKRKGMYERISFNLTPAQEALRALWNATYPNQELHGLISEQWKLMGWQGKDPSTDFRGAGFISLENLLFFAKTFSASFQRLLNKQGGKRAAWEYPFAVAGVNITFMIIQMLDLRSRKSIGILLVHIKVYGSKSMSIIGKFNLS